VCHDALGLGLFCVFSLVTKEGIIMVDYFFTQRIFRCF
jgi:hypothetical protein